MIAVDVMLRHAPHKTVTKRCVAALVLVLSMSLNVRAETLTFTFNGSDNGSSTISKTQSGITLTLSNPNPATTFRADSDGIAVGEQGSFLPEAGLTSFQLTVLGGSLALKSYFVGYSTYADDATFSMSGGTGSSSGNPLGNAGSFNAAGNWVLAPGETGILTVTGFDPTDGFPALAQVASMSFEVVPVPEPSTFALGAAGLACAAWLRHRRRLTAQKAA